MNMYSAAAKLIGAVTAGAVLYDAHKTGTLMGTMTAKKNTADAITDYYVQTNTASKLSTIEVNAKKAWLRFNMDNNIPEACSSVVGYVKGALNSFVSDIVPAALATGAILSNNKFGKLCGLGLLAYGAKYLLFDIMGVGRRDYLKETV